MNDVFFAHSVKEKGREAWEPLIDHLTEVGERAARFATAFGYGEFGYAAGLLHDLGKYQAAFQARLAGNAERVDHAAHGACYARRALHPLGGLIAHAIAGHHGGLADNLLTSDPESRLGRMGLTLDAIVAGRGSKGLSAWRVGHPAGSLFSESETSRPT